MKTLFLIAALALAAALPVRAYDNLPLLSGGTNNVLGLATNTYNVGFSATKSTSVAIQETIVLSGAGTSNVTVNVDSSLDNSSWNLAAFSIVRAATGTTPLVVVTNIPVGSVGYFRLGTVINGNAAALTNLAIKAVTKRDL